MKSILKVLGLGIATVTLLGACSEPPQIAARKALRPDVAPYMGADNGFMTKNWKPGDQASWTESVDKRTLSQSEQRRTK